MGTAGKDPYEGFQKKKDFLICIDSDGCAMDTMDIKHFRCFGPCMVEEWGLEDQEEKLLFRWNQINLYSMTRGINRFKALALMLKEINDSGTPIEDVDVLVKWADEADELSNSAIGKEAEKNRKHRSEESASLVGEREPENPRAAGGREETVPGSKGCNRMGSRACGYRDRFFCKSGCGYGRVGKTRNSSSCGCGSGAECRVQSGLY